MRSCGPAHTVDGDSTDLVFLHVEPVTEHFPQVSHLGPDGAADELLLQRQGRTNTVKAQTSNMTRGAAEGDSSKARPAAQRCLRLQLCRPPRSRQRDFFTLSLEILKHLTRDWIMYHISAESLLREKLSRLIFSGSTVSITLEASLGFLKNSLRLRHTNNSGRNSFELKQHTPTK